MGWILCDSPFFSKFAGFNQPLMTAISRAIVSTNLSGSGTVDPERTRWNSITCGGKGMNLTIDGVSRRLIGVGFWLTGGEGFADYGRTLRHLSIYQSIHKVISQRKICFDKGITNRFGK
jgi:hypothetical protein